MTLHQIVAFGDVFSLYQGLPGPPFLHPEISTRETDARPPEVEENERPDAPETTRSGAV